MSRRRCQSTRISSCPNSHSISRRGFLAPAIINEANIHLTEQEHQSLKLGPRFIFDDPKIASRRRIIELATLKRKIEARFLEKKVSPGRPIEEFIAELDVLLQKLHNTPDYNHYPLSQSQSNGTFNINKRTKNFKRIVKRLRYKTRLVSTIVRKSDKSKVCHLGKVDDYEKRSEEYMVRTQSYKCVGKDDPLLDLIQRTNKYLLNLRLAKWITQEQYEQLCINPNEVELAHLYYLPKPHKIGTPLYPIISGLKHPTIKISKFLDDLLRPLFDQMASKTTIISGFERVKKLQE